MLMKSKNTPVVMKVENVDLMFRKNYNTSLKDLFVNILKIGKVDNSSFKGLDNVSFEVRKGEAVGVIGYNGSGKSTLLKCISGVLTPEKGKILLSGRVAGLLEVGAGFSQGLTGRENIFLNGAILGMSKKEIEKKFDSIVEFSEIDDFIDTEVRYYSSGMYVRLAFSIAIHAECDIFLADEVLSVGDKSFREKCMKKIQEIIDSGKTIFFVSHNENQVKQICDRVILIEKGKIIADGYPDEVFKIMDRLKQTKERPPRGRQLLNEPFDDYVYKSIEIVRGHKLILDKKNFVEKIEFNKKEWFPQAFKKAKYEDELYTNGSEILLLYTKENKHKAIYYRGKVYVQKEKTQNK